MVDPEVREVALQLSDVTKQYKLGQIGYGTLQKDLQSWWAKKRGKEDPNKRIGRVDRLVGETFMALNGVDLTVYKGEALGIIGANGAGKSTLLKLLSRVTAPSTGDIDIYGRISSMLEIGTGFNGQMTGRENVYLNGAILGMSRAEIDAQMDSIIEFSEIKDFIDTPVKRYSSGMFVKLAFAVAAHLKSEIMIMDEVLAVGDMAFQKKCLAKMKEAASEEGRTVLYVSHNMNTIRELCSRCIVMDKGKIIYDGDVDKAINVYMSQSLQKDLVDIDLSQAYFPRKVVTRDLCMQRLVLVNKDAPIYDSNENLKLRLSVDVKKPLQQVQLRITFRSDTDQAIGTAWSLPVNIDHEGINDIMCSFNLNELVCGDVYISIGVYKMSDAGYMLQLDHVSRAFGISIVSKVGIKNWSIQAYGPVQFSNLMCEVLKNDNL